MPDNPFAAPESRPPAPGVRSGRQADVLAVARYQKGILWCILANIFMLGLPMVIRLGLVGVPFGTDQGAEVTPAVLLLLQLIPLAFLILSIVQLVVTLMLALKVYHPAMGAVMGPLTLIPLLGLLILVLVNSRATNILKQNGFRVGLLGANLQEVRAAVEREESVADESPRVD